MKTNKRKLLSILTAFVMAFTVFGCTGMSFAEETTGDDQGVQTMGEPEPDTVGGTEAEVETPDEVAEPEGDVAVMGSAESVGDTWAKLQWETVEPQGEGTVYYIVTSEPSIDPITVKNGTAYEVTGLQPETAYTFTVTAWQTPPEGEDFEIGPVGDPISVTTLARSINPPTGLKAKGAYRTVTLSWGNVKPKYGGTISYEITGNGKTYKNCKSPYTIKGLSPRKDTYKYKVKVTETVDGVPVTAATAFPAVTTTDFSSFGALSGLVSDPGYKAVLLQWNKIDGATGYEIYWRKGGERGNIDTVGRDSDGHWMKTFKSSKTKKYVMPKKPGKYKHLDTVEQPKSGKLVKYDKRGLDIMNHTYVYFYQFMIVPYYEDNQGRIYTKAAPDGQWNSDYYNGTSNKVAAYSIPKHNIVRNNTVLPMYVYETAKVNKPIYKTCSMNDGKKRGRLHKGHKFICWDKANGRVKFYGKKDGSGQPGETYWFAQKNAHTIQGYYMDNCRYGGKTDLKRKDWKTGYSKKTVLDYVNHCGIKSKTKYFVWASKYAQHVYILKKASNGKWELLDGGKNRIPTNTKGCWSNLCASGKVNIQSRNGHYVIFGKQYKANRSAYDYYCLSKLHKTVRLHSLLYKNGKKFSSFSYKNKVLGNPISKGCIRMRPYAAQWVYKHVPKKTRTLVY